MACKECRECNNYLVSEVGCFGEDNICEYLSIDNQEYEKICKIVDIKDYLENKIKKIASINKIGDSYENGYCDATYEISEYINKIINS